MDEHNPPVMLPNGEVYSQKVHRFIEILFITSKLISQFRKWQTKIMVSSHVPRRKRISRYQKSLKYIYLNWFPKNKNSKILLSKV